MAAVLFVGEALNNPINKLAAAVKSIDTYPPNKTAQPVFIGGIRYPSLFDASYDSGIRSVSIWKAIKKRGGGPAQVRKTFVVLEAWVMDRAANLKGVYQL